MCHFKKYLAKVLCFSYSLPGNLLVFIEESRLCESVLVRGCYHLPRTFTDQHGLIGRPCLFLCVLCGFARNSSLKIQEFQKNCVSLQTSRRHGVPPCKHSNGISQALLCGGTPHLLYKIHGRNLAQWKFSVESW